MTTGTDHPDTQRSRPDLTDLPNRGRFIGSGSRNPGYSFKPYVWRRTDSPGGLQARSSVRS